jgi:Nuclear transport factor 2 (NTF2) domain
VTGPADQALLAAVERSPAAAAAHDRAGWVGLFTTDGRVEDPVGSRPHSGAADIGRFYDTFIGPREISFHRDLDIVRGSSVIRDLDLEVVMGSAVTMTIPAFLRYDLSEVDGEWKIAMLKAYWELPAMMWEFLRNGVSAAVGRGDRFAAQQTLSSGATITFGDGDTGEAAGTAELAERCAGAKTTKVIAAGCTVAASVTAGPRRGVLFADVTRRGTGVHRIRYFPQ